MGVLDRETGQSNGSGQLSCTAGACLRGFVIVGQSSMAQFNTSEPSGDVRGRYTLRRAVDGPHRNFSSYFTIPKHETFHPLSLHIPGALHILACYHQALALMSSERSLTKSGTSTAPGPTLR